MMGLLKCPRSSWASKLDAHPLSFFLLSFHTSIALVHPLHGNPYSLHWHQLMGISIARWLAASMWDFLLFVFSTQPPSLYSIPPIVLCPWLTLMYCVEVEKVWETSKVWNNCLACHRGCAWWEQSCVTKMKHSQTIWFCRDKLSLAMLFWEDIIA